MMLRRAFLDISGYGSQLGNLFPVDLHLSWPVSAGEFSSKISSTPVISVTV